MKRIINFLFVINALYLSAQQESVGIGTTNPDAPAILDVTSSNKGLQLPVVYLTSTTDVTTIPNPKTGFIIYNNAVAGSGNTSVSKGLYAFNGTGWERMWTKSDVKTEINLDGKSACGYTDPDPLSNEPILPAHYLQMPIIST